ncbi:hypothetical protein [Paracidobacterium acidisoli]|uniref:Uncharacterized protein n=1 Tax=Paracidobacterium acidisoli TaxID=2303751 RepID=A0A372IMW2_9BACT|nr:hypothetical protein [Paracidobacterium acidisoli]MBT9331719.1 hypothetical protein [Paracidobacterium acidisoli]
MSSFPERQRHLSRRRLLCTCALAAGLTLPACAQYPGHVDTTQTDNQPHLRATGVYEYTGDLTSPKASRLIPIAVWDGTRFQPGGLYLAQPAPLAVEAGTLYELQTAGQRKGLFDIREAEDVGGSWIGVGVFQKEKPPQPPKLRASKHLPQVVKDYDPDKPHFAHLPSDEGPGSAGSSGSAGNSGKSTSGSAASAPPIDPDRPTLHKRSSSGDDTSTASGNAPAPQVPVDVDPDRPTLHKRSDAGSAAASSRADAPPVDPSRPRLAYGRPETTEAIDKPDALTGTPSGMEQIVAVSDPQPGEPHPFAYSWPDPSDITKTQTALETIASKALAPPAPPAPKTKLAPRSTTRARTVHRPAAPPASPGLTNEEFHAYELAYGAGATFVFSAEKKTPDGSMKYITLIAKPDFSGNPQVMLQHITSDKELEFNPRMQLVDAVDADGDHRAELIFELRGKSDRQFAIYRVAYGSAESVFTTASLH